MRNWHKFCRLSPQEKMLLIEASVLLPLTALAIRSIGFRRWKSALVRIPPTIESYCAIKDEPARLKALLIADVVKIAAWHGLHRGNCLEQSLVLWWLLGRQGIKSDLRFGARKNTGRFEAHAWVEVAGIPLNEKLDVHQIFAGFDPLVIPTKANPL